MLLLNKQPSRTCQLNDLYIDRTNRFVHLLSSHFFFPLGVQLPLAYKCQFLLNTHTSSFPGVWFSLRNTTYQNNSIVTLDDIGEGDDALLCKTNGIACCRSTDISYPLLVLGNWFFPSGARVSPASYNNNNTDFFRDRDKMVVRLNRRRGGEDGIYRCEIPDSANVTQTIYIGVYTAGSGE